jgi:hypothetical protein
MESSLALILLLTLSLLVRPKLPEGSTSVPPRPRGRVLVLDGGASRKTGLLGVCVGVEELFVVTEERNGGTGGISIFGSGGNGHTGLLITIDGVSRRERPGEEGILDLGPIVLLLLFVMWVGDVDTAVKDGELIAGSVAPFSCEVVRGGIGIDRLGFGGRGLGSVETPALGGVL